MTPGKTWEDPMEEGMATHSSILAWKIPMDKYLAGTVHGVTKLDTAERLITAHVSLSFPGPHVVEVDFSRTKNTKPFKIDYGDGIS